MRWYVIVKARANARSRRGTSVRFTRNLYIRNVNTDSYVHHQARVFLACFAESDPDFSFLGFLLVVPHHPADTTRRHRRAFKHNHSIMDVDESVVNLVSSSKGTVECASPMPPRRGAAPTLGSGALFPCDCTTVA